MKLSVQAMGWVMLGLALAGLGGAEGMARAADPAPSHIAVVNMAKVFNALAAKKNGDMEIEAMARKLDGERKEKVEAVEKLRAELEQYNKDSPIYTERMEELLKKGMELDGHAKYMQDRLMLETRVRVLAVYRQMNTAIADYAKANGIGLVLATEDPDFASARTPSELVQRISGRKVVFAHESFDITSAIVEKMNREYSEPKAPTTSK